MGRATDPTGGARRAPACRPPARQAASDRPAARGTGAISRGARLLTAAYVDTSCLVAISFGERGGSALARRLESFDELFAANLLEAELRASFAREGVPLDSELLGSITWILPDRPLSPEITTVLSAGYVRGADLWHLACALYLVNSPRDMAFITLDARQAEVARQLGFSS